MSFSDNIPDFSFLFEGPVSTSDMEEEEVWLREEWSQMSDWWGDLDRQCFEEVKLSLVKISFSLTLFVFFGSLVSPVQSEWNHLIAADNSFHTNNISWEWARRRPLLGNCPVNKAYATAKKNCKTLNPLQSVITSCVNDLFMVLSCKPLFMQRDDPCNEGFQAQEVFLLISPQSISVPSLLRLLVQGFNAYLICHVLCNL